MCFTGSLNKNLPRATFSSSNVGVRAWPRQRRLRDDFEFRNLLDRGPVALPEFLRLPLIRL